MSRSFAFDVDALRTFLHLLSVSVWVGGQIGVAGLIPLVRKVSAQVSAPEGEPSVTQKIARRFSRVAWPFYALAIITGLWNIEAVARDWSETTLGWRVGFFAKIILVVLSGVGAWLHGRAKRAPERAIFASLASLSALAALLLAASFTSG